MDEEHLAKVAILNYLGKLQTGASTHAAQLLQARSLLSQAFGVDAAALREEPEHSLPALLSAGRAALKQDVGKEKPAGDEAAFDKFLSKLKGTAFFAGAEEGSDEYTRRVAKARAKFDQHSPSVTATATAKKEIPVSGGNKSADSARAETLKSEGNAKLKAGDYSGAVDLYTSAIELDGSNAIYYGNRAAAKMHLHELASAVDDCKMAISIDPSYARAHERLASAYKGLGLPDAELEALEAAAAHHPDNAQLARMLADAKTRVSGTPASAGGGVGAPAGMPSPEALADMAAGMGLPGVDSGMLQGMMNSPMAQAMLGQMGGPDGMAAMMEQVSKNPEMLKGALEMMKSNPDMLANLMGGFGGGANDPDKNPPPGSA